MRVRKKYLLLILSVILIMIFSNLSLASECTYGNDSPCYPGYCSGRGDCVDTCNDGTCQDGSSGNIDYGETCSNCALDCGECPSSFSSDGVCEYDAGERISSFGDDCDQDGDGYYDHCGEGDGVTVENCVGVVSGSDVPDRCPSSSSYPVGVGFDGWGCSCCPSPIFCTTAYESTTIHNLNPKALGSC